MKDINGEFRPEEGLLLLIAREMDVGLGDIYNIKRMEKGMTNRSFTFRVNGGKYIMRVPGEGTDQLINRGNEYKVYQLIRDLDLSDELIYMSKEEGYKITRFVEGSTTCDPFNWDHVARCMDKLKGFHEMALEIDHEFDLYETIEYYESLWQGRESHYEDYKETKEKMWQLKTILEDLPKDIILSHVDAVADNFLLTDDDVRLIDWEYAAMQDPHLDIAMFAIYSNYNLDQVEKLIDIYFKGRPSDEIRLKIYIYIALAGFLWSNWCEYKKFLGVDFGQYALDQYNFAKRYYKKAMNLYERIS